MNTNLSYNEFLSRKVKSHNPCGFESGTLNPMLFPFQEYIVRRALKVGRFAIFADCGLGKTFMQLEWAHRVSEHTGRPVLILAPLAVVGQTEQQAHAFGFSIGQGIHIANYEQLENIEATQYAGIVLDESSILKNFEGATRNLLIEKFANTPYKLCCTATPAPNDPMELGNHSEFLSVMGRNEMLAMYYTHDGGDTSKWRLKKHAQDRYWQWVSSWALMLSKPSDIGFSDEGYVLPPLQYFEHHIVTPKQENGKLYNDTTVSGTEHNAELRATMDARMQLTADLVNATEEPFIVWIKQDEEGDTLRRLIPGAVEVRGSEKSEVKKRKLLGFADGDFRVLITKAKIAQFGLNYQHCHNQVFPSLDFSFEGLYQAVRRSYRFGQQFPVNIHLVTTDTMQNVRESIQRKQKQFEEMQAAMQREMNTCFSHEVARALSEKRTIKTPDLWLMEGDCVQRIREVPDESVGFSIFSPPFPELYTYSDALEDMGNSRDYNEFFAAFNFLVPELYRVLWSGRNVAVHCMDLPVQKGKEGYIGLRDFPAMIREAFEAAGFIFHSRVTIWKDPVVEMQRTKALGLLHKQVKKDAAMSRVGLPDYLMVFRKPGEHTNPVRCDIPVDLWQKYASPVWMDIDYGDTLNGRKGRGDRDEKHICPLQLPTIERAAHLWSNPGDWVLSPFGGIGSEGFQAIKMGRKSISIELKASYFDLNIQNHKAAKEGKKQLNLLDAFTDQSAA